MSKQKIFPWLSDTNSDSFDFVHLLMYLNRSPLNHPEDASYTGEFPHNQISYSWKHFSLLTSRS